jgi:hypothetical protein
MNNNVVIDIAPLAQGHLGRLDAISLERECFIVFNYVGMSPSIIFSVQTEDYFLLLHITDSHAELVRNNYRINVPLAKYDRSHVFVLNVLWTPELLRIAVIDREGQRKAEIKTPTCFPPNSLKDWARRESLIPTVFYETPRHFFEIVFAQFQQLKEKIIDTNAINGFWDIQYNGSKIISRKPKRETDIHPQIRLLLHDIEILKNIQVIPEYPIGSGQLDFLVTGTTTNGKTVSVCVEFKLAHSPDIAHGIQVQLPEYMNRQSTDFGIYGVLNFGEEYKSDTSKFVFKNFKSESNDLEFILPIAASETGRNFLKTIIFELSKRIPPSKK